MADQAPDGKQKVSECRALVPVEPRASGRSGGQFAAAPFVVQLAANARGLAPYRAKRRTDAKTCMTTYRANATQTAHAPSRTVCWL